ncbi:MAG: FKBP-type peptidyl-prolyl cis-trans isomerase [Ostreibacterium sp.]
MIKKLTLATTLSLLAVGALAADLDNDDQKITYTIGSQIGQSLKEVKNTINLDDKILFEAITDALSNKKSQLNNKDMTTALQTLQKKMGEKIQAEKEKLTAKNTAEAEKLLAENKAKEGVFVTNSGLQYRVIKKGTGKKPSITDTVKVNYKGTLADGSVFDDSAKSGGPVEIPLNAVVTGWKEALQLMPVGSTYEFVIPANLAYGKEAPPKIGPDRALIFKVELLDITTAKIKKETKKASTDEKSTDEKSTDEKMETVKEEIKKSVKK